MHVSEIWFDVATRSVLGSPNTIRQRLVALESTGIQEVILNFQDVLRLDALRFFAQEFIA